MLAQARKLHIPLIRSLSWEIGYDGESLATDLGDGMRMVGLIPRTSSLPAKEAPAAMILLGARGAVRAASAKVLKSLSKSTVWEV